MSISQAIPPIRNSKGLWTHPDYPHWKDQDTYEDYQYWLDSNQIDIEMVLLDFDACDNVIQRFKSGEHGALVDWEPSPKNTHGHLISIHKYKESAVALFAIPRDAQEV